ncbi:hypothetical protein ACFWCA_32800 [Streptomyces phaeochromogenes]|uniref:hypothetical protein n=1 Tax=Streptomyces phaeochromogenes TaxID=1923 RepID=UPI003691C6BA
MAATMSTALTQCPECDEPLLIPVRAHQRGVQVTLAVDLSQVRDHAATHEARFTTELPPTAR